MIVHICCSVDSHHFLEELSSVIKNEKIVGYFYNPNIHPKEEYELRLFDVRYSARRLGIEIIDGEYEYDRWMKRTYLHRDCKEGGNRCQICFENRLEATAIKSLKLNHKSFTTTLLTSPKKSLEDLKKSGESIAKKYNLEFSFFDFRKAGGTQKQFEIAKKDALYKQRYCGCIYALKDQRERAQKSALELLSPICQTPYPGTIRERALLFEKRDELKRESKANITLKKSQRLCYIILKGKIALDNITIPSHILYNSKLTKKELISGVTLFGDEVLLKKEPGAVISLERYSRILNKTYKNIESLIFSKKDYRDDIRVREEIYQSPFDLSFLAVVQNLSIFNNSSKLKIELDFESFEERVDIISL